MNDDPTAGLQPDAGAALDAPVVPADPQVPDVPVIPAADDNKMSEQEQAEADEWSKAAEAVDLTTPKENDNEQSKPGEKPKEKEAPTDPKAPEASDADKAKTGEEAAKDGTASGEEAGTDDTAEAEPINPRELAASLTPREQAQIVDNARAEVREKLFADVPTTLKDADGDPINNIDDVMRLTNPRTGEPFTANEAESWLSLAKQQFRDNLNQMEVQVSEIASVNLSIKDEADMIKYQYGELLKALPTERDAIWAEYEKTLTKDPKTGIITKAPVSLEKFYQRALEPLALMGRRLEAEETAKGDEKPVDNKDAADAGTNALDAPKAPAAKPDPKAAAEAAKAAKQQKRADRSDIYAASNRDDVKTGDDKEWGDAIKNVFPQLSNK